MQKSTKILIGVLAGLAVVIVILATAAIYWISTSGTKYAKAFVQDAEKEIAAGRKAGETVDDSTCLRMALDRSKNGSSIREVMGANLFLNGCLQTARETGEFCSGVPSANEIMKSATWPRTRCSELGADNEICRQLVRAVQVHCDEVRKRGPGGSDARTGGKEEKEKEK